MLGRSEPSSALLGEEDRPGLLSERFWECHDSLQLFFLTVSTLEREGYLAVFIDLGLLSRREGCDMSVPAAITPLALASCEREARRVAFLSGGTFLALRHRGPLPKMRELALVTKFAGSRLLVLAARELAVGAGLDLLLDPTGLGFRLTASRRWGQHCLSVGKFQILGEMAFLAVLLRAAQLRVGTHLFVLALRGLGLRLGGCCGVAHCTIGDRAVVTGSGGDASQVGGLSRILSLRLLRPYPLFLLFLLLFLLPLLHLLHQLCVALIFLDCDLDWLCSVLVFVLGLRLLGLDGFGVRGAIGCRCVGVSCWWVHAASF
mmetsp:Transcript_492/g.1598  ORF Transcript_492/g.1598 Transcript_492/m.1598 type:complete len:318 (-) Transcript_492:113-1066(-)